MANLTPEQLKEKYKSLPQDVQDAIFAVDSATVIQKVGRKYNLPIDKVGELADEAGLLMLGVTHPKDFMLNLTRRLKMNKEEIRDITKEINEKIFSKIRASLKKIHGIEDEKQEEKVSISQEEIGKIAPISDIMEEKTLPSIFRTPSAVSERKEDLPVEDLVKDNESPKTENGYSGQDPYRETIE